MFTIKRTGLDGAVVLMYGRVCVDFRRMGCVLVISFCVLVSYFGTFGTFGTVISGHGLLVQMSVPFATTDDDDGL